MNECDGPQTTATTATNARETGGLYKVEAITDRFSIRMEAPDPTWIDEKILQLVEFFKAAKQAGSNSLGLSGDAFPFRSDRNGTPKRG